MCHIWEGGPTHLGSDIGLRQVLLVSLLLCHHSFPAGQSYIVHCISLLEVISREVTINTKKLCEDLAANGNEYVHKGQFIMHMDVGPLSSYLAS